MNNNQLTINNEEEYMEQEKSNVVQEKAYRFAIRIVKAYQYLKFD